MEIEKKKDKRIRVKRKETNEKEKSNYCVIYIFPIIVFQIIGLLLLILGISL